MPEPTIKQLEKLQSALEAFLSLLKVMIDRLNKDNDRSFQTWVREYQSIRHLLSVDINIDIGTEVLDYRKRQREMLPLIQENVSIDMSISFLKVFIGLEPNAEKKKVFHKLKILLLLISITIHLRIIEFSIQQAE